tara:strand:+ start:3275 stop:4960 length:1686 start_codon:yes stop_codon:yes gene_type:complete
MTLEKKINDLILLFNNKQYKQLIYKVESSFEKNEINSQVLLILGLARMKSKNGNLADISLAIQNFKKGYIIDKKSKIGLECLTYYLYGVYEKIKQENFLSSDEYIEIKNFFLEAKSSFSYNEKLYHGMSLINIKTTDVVFRQNILKELIDKSSFKEKTLLYEYIYNHNLRYNWSQKDFLSFLDKMKEKLEIIKLPKIQEIKKKRIKIGFISSNLSSNHSVTYFIKELFNFENKNFETYIFSDLDVQKEDETTKTIKKSVDFFYNVSDKNNIELANFLRSKNIDILIDINGYLGKGRIEIFNSRVCKLQISWLGYNNTIGLNHSDYLIADKNLILENEKNMYKEKIIYLDNIWNSHSGLNIERKYNKLPSQNNKYFIFGSFNNYLKISDDTIFVWSEILKKIKNSKLILKSSLSYSEVHFKKLFEEEGVLNRVIFKNRSPNFEEHINLYKDVDLCLDTFPYTGVTTTCEALWMNVPVISMEGYNFNSRCGESILINSNLKHLVAKNKNDYISMAISFSKDLVKLEKMRRLIFNEVLKTNTFNTKKFAANFWKSILDTYTNHK